MASEVGVLDIPAENILKKCRLGPGQIFCVDIEEGKIFFDLEIKEMLARKKSYKKWIENNLIFFKENIEENKDDKDSLENLKQVADAFGYSREDLKIIIKPMAEESHEPTGSMGDDTPLAVLSERPRLIFDYFKQLFAQVTNPAIDPIREELVMSLDTYLGGERNLLKETQYHCRRIKVKSPVLTNQELSQLTSFKEFPTKRISLLFKVEEKELGFNKALERICREAESAIKKGYKFILLTDKGIDSYSMALPSLLAVGAVHHYLIKRQLRTQVSILVESAEPREVAHFALLFGYGADCINPYLAIAIVKKMCQDKEIELDFNTAKRNYLKAIEKGILKILSKMGISTLQSYRGAQIFEALGLGNEIIERCFCGTVSRIGGIGFEFLAKDVLKRHREAFLKEHNLVLSSGGLYQWKKDGEYHLWNPQTIFLLHQAVRNNDFKKYLEFAQIINNQKGHLTTLRGLFKFRKTKEIPLSEVESSQSIIRRFVSGAMSFG
ncbi:MAG: glutamate synthase-related protein, partial [Candidatus Omnitrophica bacterium]|nr:glutamate synthase-related protein [Candidatus Omnitrophota bacterium]